MCRTCPRVSANTTAQNPAGSVMPPLSLAHAVLEAVVVDVLVVSDDRLPSPLLQATNASSVTLLIKRNAYIGPFRKKVNADTALDGRLRGRGQSSTQAPVRRWAKRSSDRQTSCGRRSTKEALSEETRSRRSAKGCCRRHRGTSE